MQTFSSLANLSTLYFYKCGAMQSIGYSESTELLSMQNSPTINNRNISQDTKCRILQERFDEGIKEWMKSSMPLFSFMIGASFGLIAAEKFGFIFLVSAQMIIAFLVFELYLAPRERSQAPPFEVDGGSGLQDGARIKPDIELGENRMLPHPGVQGTGSYQYQAIHSEEPTDK
jgi:hypothetical protein